MNAAEYRDMEHLETAVIAAYLDGNLGENDLDDVESHLADCEACSREVLALHDTLRSYERRKVRRVWLPAVAVAAVLAGLFLLQPWVENPALPEREMPLERGAADVDGSSLQALAPENGASVGARGLGFAWRSVGPGARYLLTLTTVNGDSVWTAVTADTSAVLPNDVTVIPGEEYYWYVDALLPSGETATTGVRNFRAVP